ncbi:hypothetical protein [Occallatibacter riparius]|uniref:Uncharacterized protein n=1 Tax=Occallatibacter riparius TaxID=1002689 RepID=A0A9J7BKW8_9BACT|nr:hypothetical protein [Occallatibacter riparius]UWZ83251.1 hypothetical protein MOP44_22110 [Occallatibacter riparius]
MTRSPVRGTQSIVGQMGWVFARPSLTVIEVVWRWLVGAPILFVCWVQLQKIVAELPPETTGLNALDITNPWVSALKLAVAWDMYRPHLVMVLRWLVPAAAIAWIVVSGIGRNIVLRRMEPRITFRPVAMIVLQAAWVAVFAITGWAWWASIGWAANSHIGTGAEPDLVGYTMWAIFLTLGFFTLWALINWVVAIAPMILLLEDCSTTEALARSFKLGKPFTSKLVEVNLVMGIVKLALLVLAMVFSSVLIPFADQVGAGTLHVEWLFVSVFYFVASDYFHVVRLKGFIEFWHIFRETSPASNG